ncbi:MAG: hypothetical protein ABI664_14640 [bacterium]
MTASRHQRPPLKKRSSRLSAQQVNITELAGEKTENVLTEAPGNGAPIGGVKVIAKSGWFAARPSGTEEIYKIYAESFKGADHLHRVLDEAQRSSMTSLLEHSPQAQVIDRADDAARR